MGGVARGRKSRGTRDGALSLGISEPFIRRPVATTLLSVGLLLFGLLAYLLLPVSPLPQVDLPTVSVSASLPGADPETMAASVAAPLERRFSQIAGVTELTSSSSLGSSQVTLQFELDRKVDNAVRDVQAAINGASGELPGNLPQPPIYRKVNPGDSPILVLALTSPTLPLGQVHVFADQLLAQRLSQVSGVSQVQVNGAQKSAIRVQVNPQKLAVMGISLEEVRAAVAATTIDQPKGSLDGATESFALATNDQLLLNAEAYRSVVVTTRQGVPVPLMSIAEVVEAPENTRAAGWFDRDPAVLLTVFKQPDANVIETVDRIKTLLPQLRAWMPAQVKLSVLVDRTQTIRASIRDVQFTLMVTTALVVMVVFLFLRRGWTTFAASVTVPLALAGTFAAMYLMHYSLNNLSLMALTISVGFVVDDAIVMLENIVRHLEMGEPPVQAALKGARQVGFTVVSISVSLIAVFIPLLFMGGIVGRLFHEFAVTLSLTVALSALVSLTLTPMVCAHFLRLPPRGTQKGRFDRMGDAALDKAVALYDQCLKFVLEHQTAVLSSFVAVIAATLYLYAVIPKGFFPTQDTGLMVGITQAAPDISFKAMVAQQQTVGNILLEDPAIEGFGSFIGSTANSGRMFIALKPPDKRERVEKVIERLRKKLGKLTGVRTFLQPVQDIRVGGRASAAVYQYALSDPDIEELNLWAPRLLEAMRQEDALRDVNSDQLAGGIQAKLDIDRVAAARLGITPADIDAALYDAFGQRQVANLYTEVNQYHVVLEALPADQLSPDALSQIYIKSAAGAEVPLSTVATVSFTTAPLSVTHQGQFPAVTLSFNLAPGVSLSQGTEVIQRVSERISLPARMRGSFQGTAQVFAESVKNIPLLVLAALLAVYLVLGVLYESLIHPLTILSTLPSAGLGALLAMLAVGDELSMISLIGIILLMGIVKKNGIMLVDFALEAEREEGLSARDAIHRACLQRFRPILMTTLAALFGALPLAFGSGVGSELRRPLGIAIVGGLLVSQALTLFTTPVVYLLMDRLAQRAKA